MAEVVEALEGSIAPVDCISLQHDGTIVCSRETHPGQACPTKLLWTRVQGAIVGTLRQTTLADLLGASGRLDGTLIPLSGPVTPGSLSPEGRPLTSGA